MSIVSMANAAIARRADLTPATSRPTSPAAIAEAARSTTAPTTASATALDIITTYIPTELITLYVAFIAVLGKSNSNAALGWWGTTIFVVCTPIVIWLVFAGKVKAAGKELPLAPTKWPLWEMAAGTIAFLAWAFALPDTPLTTLSWYSSALAGFLLLVAQVALSQLAPIFQQPLNP